jgi:F-box/leucine-rich repeat protein 10/11
MESGTLLKAMVMFIHALPVTRKNVPALIPDPVELIRDVREVVELHKGSAPEKAVTGRPLLYWSGVKQV